MQQSRNSQSHPTSRASVGPRRRWTREEGQALVEFALVLPVLLLLLLAALDFGKAFNYWNDETHLANEGARWAAVNTNPGGSTSLPDYIKSQADASELRTNARVCISYPNGTASIGDPVKIEVSSDYSFLNFIADHLSQPTVNLDATSVMRLEQLPTNFPSSGTSCSS
jgi:hypothetical protein